MVKKNILIVDDNDFILEVYAAVMRKAGFLVDTRNNGQDTIDMVYQNEIGYYSLIVVDYHMPGMNGIELLKHLKGIGKTPVLLLTGRQDILHAVSGDKLSAVDQQTEIDYYKDTYGFDGYVNKSWPNAFELIIEQARSLTK